MKHRLYEAVVLVPYGLLFIGIGVWGGMSRESDASFSWFYGVMGVGIIVTAGGLLLVRRLRAMRARSVDDDPPVSGGQRLFLGVLALLVLVYAVGLAAVNPGAPLPPGFESTEALLRATSLDEELTREGASDSWFATYGAEDHTMSLSFFQMSERLRSIRFWTQSTMRVERPDDLSELGGNSWEDLIKIDIDCWKDRMAVWGPRILAYLYPDWADAEEWVATWGGGEPDPATPEKTIDRDRTTVSLGWDRPGESISLTVRVLR